MTMTHLTIATVAPRRVLLPPVMEAQLVLRWPVSDVRQAARLREEQGELPVAGGVLDPLHDAPNQEIDSLLHIGPGAGARLDVGQPIAPAEARHLLPADHAQLEEIALVAAEHYVRILRVGVRPQLRQPVGRLQEALLAGQVEDEQEAHGVAVESGCQRPEALLPGGVPDLQVDAVAASAGVVQLQGGGKEVHGLILSVYKKPF